jgi:hypothetical protein
MKKWCYEEVRLLKCQALPCPLGMFKPWNEEAQWPLERPHTHTQRLCLNGSANSPAQPRLTTSFFLHTWVDLLLLSHCDQILQKNNVKGGLFFSQFPSVMVGSAGGAELLTSLGAGRREKESYTRWRSPPLTPFPIQAPSLGDGAAHS